MEAQQVGRQWDLAAQFDAKIIVTAASQSAITDNFMPCLQPWLIVAPPNFALPT